MAVTRRIFARTRHALARLPLRFSLSGLFIVVSVAALVMAWNVSSQGSVPIHTGRDLDAAIFGVGYFQVTMPNGQVCYTRSGHFAINCNGQLVVGRPEDNILIQPNISFPQDCTHFLITPDGTVQTQQAKSGNWQCLGQIQLARFMGSGGLTEVAPDVWEDSNVSGPALTTDPGKNGAGFIYQGWVEPTAGPSREQLRYQLA